MAETGLLFYLVDSLQQIDLSVQESHFPVIAAMIKSGAPAYFANETLFIIY